MLVVLFRTFGVPYKIKAIIMRPNSFAAEGPPIIADHAHMENLITPLVRYDISPMSNIAYHSKEFLSKEFIGPMFRALFRLIVYRD